MYYGRNLFDFLLIIFDCLFVVNGWWINLFLEWLMEFEELIDLLMDGVFIWGLLFIGLIVLIWGDVIFGE